MAKVGKNVLTRGLSGKLGNQVVFRQAGENTLMASVPRKRTKPPTEAQQLHLQQFKEAVLYAKSITADPVKKAEYKAAAENGESAFNIAVADFLKLPVVRELDPGQYTGEIGSKIRVKAFDNFKLVSVSVGIFTSNNTLVESGSAVKGSNGLDWFYTATSQNTPMTGGKVVATVTDTPGHSAEMSKML